MHIRLEDIPDVRNIWMVLKQMRKYDKDFVIKVLYNHTHISLFYTTTNEKDRGNGYVTCYTFPADSQK